MKIAIPVFDGELCEHFGQCNDFALFEVAEDRTSVISRQDVPAPSHQPGRFPEWLHEQGVTVVLAGGMGSMAQELFASHGIQVVTGADQRDPDQLVAAFLSDELSTVANFCEK